MIVPHIALNLFISNAIILSVTLTIFQGHSSVKQFCLNILFSYPIQFKLCRVVKYIMQAMNIPLFVLL